MTLQTTDIRIFVYETLIVDGRVPTAADIGARLGVSRDDVVGALRQARIGKTLLPDPRTGELWMAGPFSARPTSYEITSGARRWWGNCAWDMLGVAHLVGQAVEMSAACSDCGEPFSVHFAPGSDAIPDWVVHFLLPARRWYDDIGFT